MFVVAPAVKNENRLALHWVRKTDEAQTNQMAFPKVAKLVRTKVEQTDCPDGSALGTVDGRGVERVDGITNGRDDGLVVGTKVGVADGL